MNRVFLITLRHDYTFSVSPVLEAVALTLKR